MGAEEDGGGGRGAANTHFDNNSAIDWSHIPGSDWLLAAGRGSYFCFSDLAALSAACRGSRSTVDDYVASLPQDARDLWNKWRRSRSSSALVFGATGEDGQGRSCCRAPPLVLRFSIGACWYDVKHGILRGRPWEEVPMDRGSWPLPGQALHSAAVCAPLVITVQRFSSVEAPCAMVMSCAKRIGFA